MSKPSHERKRPRWRKTKITFYTLWIVQTFFPCIFSVLSIISAVVFVVTGARAGSKPKSPPNTNSPPPHAPPASGSGIGVGVEGGESSGQVALEIFLGIGMALANFALLYYLSIKLRAVLAASASDTAAAAAAAASAHAVGLKKRRGCCCGPRCGLDSALATEDFLLTEKKGAAILLVAATAWVPSFGLATLGMVMGIMFLGKGLVALLVLVASLVGGVSLLGHLLYVWVRSIKVLIMGSSSHAGKRRRVVEGVEDGDEESGERLLPLTGDGRV